MTTHILVVTADADVCARFTRLFAPHAGDTVAIAMRCVAPTSAGPPEDGPTPALLLLDAAAFDPVDTRALRLWSDACGGVPLIMLAAAEASSDAGRHTAPPGLITATLAITDTRDTILHLLGRIAADARRNRSLARLSGDIVLAAMADAVVITDADGIVCYCNAAAYRLLAGAGVLEPDGLRIEVLMTLEDAHSRRPIEHPLLTAIREKRSVRLTLAPVLIHPDGTEIVIEDSCTPLIGADGSVDGAVMVFHDITNARELQAQADYLARHDFLTGLPNRFVAQRHLNDMLRQVDQRPRALAVMYLDLDNFKSINDTLGHAVGDALLVSVARRLRDCVRAVDLVSRQGGDEFLVLMALGTSADQAADAAQRIVRELALPHQLGDEHVRVGCSIGIALCPRHGSTEEALLQRADTALHAAKAGGRNTWRFFEDGMLTDAIRRRMLESALRHALDTNTFELFYQPKISLADNTVSGCEALLRWNHPEWGPVSPAQFVPCAEQSGLIVALGRWALAEALRQARDWRSDGRYLGPIAVNVSALELRQPDFIEHTRQCLARFGVAPAQVQMELTETALMRDVDGAMDILGQIKALGVSLAVDDFGTGYSSLSYLADLPIDLLKVDRSFVHGIALAGPRRQALLRAVLAVADNLGLAVIAEGIETSAEEAFLRDAGCLLGQGFYYSAALGAGDFIRYIDSAPREPRLPL